MRGPSSVTDASREQRVTNLELFTDLVFVFAITQLTTLLSKDQTLVGVLEVLLIFGVLWWMFGAYVWLTNAMAIVGKVQRELLLVAMMGFLVIALAIPTAFHGGGLFFGLGFALVVFVHSGLFVYASGRTLSEIARFAPMNFVGVSLILIAGVVGAPVAYLLFGLALAGQVVSSILSSRIPFAIRTGHFVERHGLLMLIVLGESIVAIGVGAAGMPLEGALIAVALLALSTTSAMWWLYFSGDDVRAEHTLASAPVGRQVGIALVAFFYATIPMILGIVTYAAGVKSAISHLAEAATPETAIALGVGVALYLLGEAILRWSTGGENALARLIAAGACVAAIPVGTATRAWAEMLTILGLLFVLILVDARRERSLTHSRTRTSTSSGGRTAPL